MMSKRLLSIILMLLCHSGSGAAATSDEHLNTLMEQAAFRETIRNQNEGALIEESTELQQSRTFARSRADYGLELRPSVSDNNVGLALRIYLPDRWSRKRLQEQLVLAARSEQLRVAALEWQDVIGIYRDFCNYRMTRKKMVLLEAEMRFIEPYLQKADERVELNQLTIRDRARLYSTYLALINDYGEQVNDLLDIERRIKLVVGPHADLEAFSELAVIEMPSQLEIESLLKTALEQRADYRQIGIDLQAMQLAEEAARKEDGFRLKYIQPGYRVNYDDGSDGWILSASIVLPWGTRNPDIAVYQNQQALYTAARSQQRRMIEDRLRVTYDMADAYYTQLAAQKKRTVPLLKTLHEDLSILAHAPLDQIRDLISIRERMLDAALQSVESECLAETIAVDLAQELGGW
jgi:hypothetical protein